jgi:hypothetical protein
MAHTSNTVTAPVSFADVNAVLHKNHTDLAALCKDSDINKFARYKSVPYPSKGTITNANRQSVAHGITIPDVVTSSTITGAAIMDAAANDWQYNKPQGGARQPYRLSDFGNAEHPSSTGYYHDAVPPIQINYPRNGWTYTRGSTSRSLIIYADLDPDDSAINLQADDFVASGLNLNEWTLIAYVDSLYFSTHLFAADDTILSDGEISGDNIVITIPSGSGSYAANVYICMYRFKDGHYEFLPLPKQGDYNPTQMKLNIKDDAEASGGGIEGDVFQNTTASYALDGVFRALGDFTDGGIAKWALRSSTGSLFLCLQLTNKSGSTSVIQRNAFNLTLEEDDYQPDFMYNSNKSAISSVTIANNATVTIYLEFNAVLANMSGWYQSNKNYNWSFDLTRRGAYLVGSDMYAFYGSNGWVQR